MKLVSRSSSAGFLLLPDRNRLLLIRAGDGDQPVPEPLERVLPADVPCSRIETVNFPFGGRYEVTTLKRDIDELATAQGRTPQFGASCAVEGDHGSFDSDE